MSLFFSVLSFFFKLRERERVYKIWYKEKQSQGYLSYFFDGIPWRISLLLRSNRLYAIFNTGLKNLCPSCPRYSFVFFYPEYWLWFVCPLRTLSNYWLSYFLFPLTGRSPHFRFRVPANHLASLSFSLVSSDLSEVTKYQHLLVSPLWPTFFLNGHSLTACYC